jgi:hypothetical protein
MRCRTALALAVVTMVGLKTTTGQAAIITPSSATASSTIGAPRTIDKTIDGSDLSSGGLSGDILSETHANNNSNSGGYWLSTNTGGNVAGEVLEFTLPSASDLNAVHIWGYHRTGSSSRSIKTFDLSFSTDGGISFPTTIAMSGLVGPGDPISVQTLPFSEQSGVTDLRISNIANFGDGNYVGLSEIRFGSPELIPEPASLALLGLGGLAMLVRRRR